MVTVWRPQATSLPTCNQWPFVRRHVHQESGKSDGGRRRISPEHFKEACNPDTLLYIGADVDINMLKLMQPWEKSAVFFDGMLDRYGNTDLKSTMEAEYINRHQGDVRPSWRRTSGNLRPCKQLSCAEPLTILLKERMEEDGAFSHVFSQGNLSIEFELQWQPGLTRTLRYVVGGPTIGAELLTSLQGRVSTIAMLAAADLGARRLRDQLKRTIPDCICNATLIAALHESFVVSRFAPILSRHAHPYPLGDTLSGRRLADTEGSVGVYCVQHKCEVEW